MQILIKMAIEVSTTTTKVNLRKSIKLFQISLIYDLLAEFTDVSNCLINS